MARINRPLVVETYMTHSRTPFITEVLKNGRIRKVARLQLFSDTREQMLARMVQMYGDRWTGIRELPPSAA